MRQAFVTLSLITTLSFLAACQHYKITDPTSGREYYTNSWNAGRYGYSGTVRFIDSEDWRFGDSSRI